MTGTLLCFGLGYSAEVLAARLAAKGWSIRGTRRDAESCDVLRRLAYTMFDYTGATPLPAEALAGVTHVLTSVPPTASGDPVLLDQGDALRACATLRWVGVLGSTAVYGDAGGAWVDELVVDLYPRDAGTDSGASYTSGDLPTAPPVPIASIGGAPFTPGVPVGTFAFTRLAVAAVPTAADLSVRAWPNPFNPRTTIAWELPADGPVRVEVFDLAGRRVRVLRDGPAPAGAGRTAWDGRDGAGRIMPAAPYVVTAESAGRRARRTVTLLK